MSSQEKHQIAILPEEVVNKIAAGEVVVRPVNAVKELIENSLDAHATEIAVSIKNGGLDLISVKDNGSGIRREDMKMVCTRHATSKLQKFEDLQSMSTYGFRGEAMASISYVSCVSVVSRTSVDDYAHKANFKDGSLMEGTLSHSAGTKGTAITAEQLFYNHPSRRQSLKYPQEEANRIVDLIIKYSIHNPHVAFAFRRLDNNSCDFRTDGKGNRHSTICTLLPHLCSKVGGVDSLKDFAFRDDRYHFTLDMCMSLPVATFTSKAIQSKKDQRKIFHVFINDRLVECDTLKRALDQVFSSKDSMCPFMTISLKIDPNCIDVNVHPTKSTVRFLHEEAIIERIEQEVLQLVNQYQQKGIIELGAVTSANDKSTGKNAKRNDVNQLATPVQGGANSPVSSQNWLLEAQAWDVSNARRKGFGNTTPKMGNKTTPKNQGKRSGGEEDSHLFLSPANLRTSAPSINVDSPSSLMNSSLRVRIDSGSRRLEEFVECRNISAPNTPAIHSDVRLVPLVVSSAERGRNADDVTVEEEGEQATPSLSQYDGRQPRRHQIMRDMDLDALDQLRRDICMSQDPELAELFHQHSFIGFIAQQFGVFQSQEKAYVIDIPTLLKELFYQLVIFSLGNMGCYRLHPATCSSSLQSAEGSNENAFVEESGTEMISIRELLSFLHDDGEASSKEDNDAKQSEIDKAVAILLDNAEMLWDYFSIEILPDSNDVMPFGCAGPFLKSLPCLLDGYAPPIENFSQFVFELAAVNYNDEQECYKGIAGALANLYTPILSPDSSSSSQLPESRFTEGAESQRVENELLLSALHHIVFPVLKTKFLPPIELRICCIQEIASIEQAFKKFGRC